MSDHVGKLTRALERILADPEFRRQMEREDELRMLEFARKLLRWNRQHQGRL